MKEWKWHEGKVKCLACAREWVGVAPGPEEGDVGCSQCRRKRVIRGEDIEVGRE